MADVFISYHRSDSASALVRRIVGELEGMGISCWYDTKDPKLGYFTDTITHEIEQCKVFLLLWDEGANESRYCISETHYAFTYAKSALIVPFQIGEFERNRKLSLYTGPYQIIFDTDELINKIATKLGKCGECGEYGGHVTYMLDKSGLTISGNGPMRDFEWDREKNTCNTPWWDERKTIFRAQILNGVTSVGYNAFFGCKELISVKIPDSVKYIETGAFQYCERLAHVDIPDSVTSIGDYAFKGCVNLASVDIPDSVTSIGNHAFKDCLSLASIDIPDNVIYIGNYSFSNCVRLTSVDISDSVTYIGEYAFDGCVNLKRASVPAEAIINAPAFPLATNVIRRPKK